MKQNTGEAKANSNTFLKIACSAVLLWILFVAADKMENYDVLSASLFSVLIGHLLWLGLGAARDIKFRWFFLGTMIIYYAMFQLSR